ncbi:hypothetical protein R6Q57_006727 [Mikania cordata]
MVQFSSLLSGLTKNISPKAGKKRRINLGREATEALAKEARKNGLLLTSPGIVSAKRSDNYVSAYSKGGNKGINQDCFIVWEEAMGSMFNLDQWGVCLKNANFDQFDVWKKSFLKACSTVDYDLELHPVIDSFYSGTAALTIIRERKPRGYTSPGGSVCESEDEPEFPGFVLRMMETPEGPGLALSRAFGDFFVKDFWSHSEPDVIQKTITTRDRFVILATDGIELLNLFTGRVCVNRQVWDVVSNEKAVEIVSAEREDSAKRIVEYAAAQWKRKAARIRDG